MFGQPAATGGFGHQRTSTSLFTPASTAPSTANPSFSLSSTATNPINPGSTATNTLSTFGTGLTTSAPSLGAAPAPSTFGSSLSTPAATPFGSAPKPALGLALNTTANTQSTLGFSLNKPAQPATGSLFGTAGTSSFNPVTQAQQQQQPQKLLSLDHAFPDTNIPFYSFSMDKSTRIAVPPQLRRSGKPNSYGSSSSLSESMRFDDKRTALPSFFDGSYSKTNDSTSSGKKRSLETENT
ncbi:hypothetical protein DM01DRAFT_31961 [Hesseltinella vesiculosa]|uniref:Uncharacterized protein n=1 Tax=Hesseltinella vesiculosa TaxID=101127 RepID=A0A1X2GUM7_9FUNG|nr:hypothetical protein DM01DRAFT_31961 [Hesseltinella vesiculosa]